MLTINREHNNISREQLHWTPVLWLNLGTVFEDRKVPVPQPEAGFYSFNDGNSVVATIINKQMKKIKEKWEENKKKVFSYAVKI